MALPKKNSRTIEVDAIRFRYIVSTSGIDETELFKLNLTVQLESGNGCLLKAEGLLTRDKWLDFPQLGSPTEYPVAEPRHVASIIRLARNDGWEPGKSGAPHVLQLQENLLEA